MTKYYGEILDTARDEIVEDFPAISDKQKMINKVKNYLKINMKYNKTRFEGQVIKVGKENDLVVWSNLKSRQPTIVAKLSTVYSGKY